MMTIGLKYVAGDVKAAGRSVSGTGPFTAISLLFVATGTKPRTKDLENNLNIELFRKAMSTIVIKITLLGRKDRDPY